MNPRPWQRRPSALARQALALYTALIVYASWYPFYGWRSLGIGPFAYLDDPLSSYLTAFDIVTNVLGYMPFGALLVLALYPRWRGGFAVLLALSLGGLLSGVMEAGQTWLPTRVASNLDLAANALGALLGAVLAAPAASALLDRGWLRRLRFLWFEREATALLGFALLWPFAAIFPTPFLFGTGDWPRVLWLRVDPVMQDALFRWLPESWQPMTWPLTLQAMLPDAGWEALVTGLNLFAAGTLASLAMRARAPRVRLLLGLIVLTLLVKMGVSCLQSRVGLVFDWMTPGARWGVAWGAVVLALTLRLRATWRAAFAALALSVALVLVNLLPLNPYFDVVLADWRQGRYIHFNGLTRWLAWIWPYAALAWLAFAVERTWLKRWRGRG
ncbi:VanZ family protein [Paraburkholderia bonniea]|uniref:VanZ family protein n=1 Tax=Paraburkholderia bonniea TaxID=2152891 RepID=UPI0012919B71|nr:VanZ family protein [Paraburkholderia bonniea]WJF90067.1 VanZ family protein [Paraburkholderia bonniea]WJF93381.1 VanZ family protein [Paraburkholderia bonniea]